MDRAKVIENLERMLSNYDMLDDIVINKNNEMLIFHRAVAKSALALLKEQETVEHGLKILIDAGWEETKWEHPKDKYAPVVRCKDCKYRFVDGDNVRFNMCLLNHNKVQPDDWFCADGEREGR